MLRVGIIASIVLALGCGSSSSTPNTVVANDFAFEPKEITVKVGDTVHWELGAGAVMHNVKTGVSCTASTQNGEDMDADLMGATTTFEHTFTHAGDVNYFCEYHCALNNMVGIVHVTQY